MKNNLHILAAKQAPQFEGAFRVRQPQWRHTRDGNPYVELLLEDMSGRLPAYIWQPAEGLSLPGELSCVHVRGQMRFRRDGVVADLDCVQETERLAEDVVRLIPQGMCPLPWLLTFLETVVERIQTPALKGYVLDVLSNDTIAFPFVACPASLGYHHNYPGGLLKHSIECVQMVERYQEFSAEQKDLGVVAVLFHDIGKILTMSPRMRLTTLGATMDHDKLTLEVLAPHLRRLDAVWPEGAIALRYLMTWRPGKRDPGLPKTPLANAVLAADRISSGIDERLS